MYSRNKVLPKLNYDSDTTGYYSSASQSDAPLSHSQFILRPSSGASSIYHLETPLLQTDHYIANSCLSGSTNDDSTYYDQRRPDSNFADADDELSTAQPAPQRQPPIKKSLAELKANFSKRMSKPLRSHSILLRLDTDTIESVKPQYNSLRRIKEKVTNSIRNFKSDTGKPKGPEAPTKIYNTRASSIASALDSTSSEYHEDSSTNIHDVQEDSIVDYCNLGYSNTLPARTSSRSTGSHYCQTIYLPSFVQELVPDVVGVDGVEDSLKKIALMNIEESTELEPVEEFEMRDLEVTVAEEYAIEDFEDHHGFIEPTSQVSNTGLIPELLSTMEYTQKSDNRTALEQGRILSPQEDVLKQWTTEHGHNPQIYGSDRDTDVMVRRISPIDRTVSATLCGYIESCPDSALNGNEDLAIEEYIEPDSSTTISSSYLNDSEENLGQLFDEAELLQQIEDEMRLQPGTSGDSQTLRRNKVFIKEPDQNSKIYFDEKLKNFKRISNKTPNPKSILKKNPAPCHIYEEIQNDYLQPYPSDIRPDPPERPVLVPNNIFQPCTSFSANMFNRGRYPKILRKKKLPSLHLFTSSLRSNPSSP